LTAGLNSSLTKLWIWYNCIELQGGTREIGKVYFEKFPVSIILEQALEKLAKPKLNSPKSFNRLYNNWPNT